MLASGQITRGSQRANGVPSPARTARFNPGAQHSHYWVPALLPPKPATAARGHATKARATSALPASQPSGRRDDARTSPSCRAFAQVIGGIYRDSPRGAYSMTGAPKIRWPHTSPTALTAVHSNRSPRLKTRDQPTYSETLIKHTPRLRPDHGAKVSEDTAHYESGNAWDKDGALSVTTFLSHPRPRVTFPYPKDGHEQRFLALYGPPFPQALQPTTSPQIAPKRTHRQQKRAPTHAGAKNLGCVPYHSPGGLSPKPGTPPGLLARAKTARIPRYLNSILYHPR